MHSNLTIQNELKELNSILAGISNTIVYTVPNGYFEAMIKDILHMIRQETVITPNAAVPEGYFEGLADVIMNKIKNGSALEVEESSLLLSLKTSNTYCVPPGYFDSLPDAVMNKINTEAEVEGSDLLHPAKKINPYSIPNGYFDALAGNIVNQLPQPAKVIVMQKRSSFFNYAAAAVITGILGLSVISIVDKRQQEEILPVTTVLADAKPISFDEALSTVSDADIEAYLQKSGEDVNAALVASASEDKNLPDQVDYLTDDKTLDNLLNELNIKDHSATN